MAMVPWQWRSGQCRHKGLMGVGEVIAATPDVRLVDHQETGGDRRVWPLLLFNSSIALVNKATLVTRNKKDFQKVPGLLIENWADGPSARVA